jgi:hypothetical protein
MPSELQSLRIPDALLAQIDERSNGRENRAETIRAELSAYFGLQTEFAAELTPRFREGGYYCSPLSALRQTLERYYESLRRARRRLRDQFSGDEQALVADVLNGILYCDSSAPAEVWQDIEDAVRHEGVAQKWSVDGPALVVKLRALSYTDACAFVDSVECFWNRISRGEQPDPRRLLEEVPRGESTAGR